MRYAIIDRMTVGWYGKQEVRQAEAFRRRVGARNISRQLKALAVAWLATREKKN